MTRGKRVSSEAREQAVLLLADTSLPMTEISAKTGITPTTLYRLVRKFGIQRPIGTNSREGTCIAPDCERPILAMRMCGMHYQRVKTHGSFDNPAPPTIEDRLWSKSFFTETGCVLWSGATTNKGYGLLHVPELGEQLVHRVSFRLYKGTIPEGFEVDHLCYVPLCFWPEHLEAVTPEVNRERAIAHRRAMGSVIPANHRATVTLMNEEARDV